MKTIGDLIMFTLYVNNAKSEFKLFIIDLKASNSPARHSKTYTSKIE